MALSVGLHTNPEWFNWIIPIITMSFENMCSDAYKRDLQYTTLDVIRLFFLKCLFTISD